MMHTQMAGSATQVHPIHIQLRGFAAHFLGVSPGLGIGRVINPKEHAAIALAAIVCFPGSVLAFLSVTFGTYDHALVLAQVLTAPSLYSNSPGYL